jgi:hypothetical protein
MIFEHSIVRTTGQIWKVHVSGLGTLVAIALILLAFLVFTFPVNNFRFVTANVLGTTLAISSHIFAVVSIKCPSCESRWVFQAIYRKRGINWYDWLAAQAVCPKCGYSADGARPLPMTDTD